MVPLEYHDQHFVHLDNSQEQTTDNSPLNQFSSQSVAKEQSQNTVTVPSSSFNKKAQSFSTLPSLKSKVRQGSSTRAMKSSSSHSKCPATPSKDHHSKSSLNPSSLSHHKPQTSSSSSFTSTSSSEPSQTSVRPRLPLPKPQTASSIDLCWKSPLLESTQRVSSSSSSALQHQETPSLNIIWTSPSLESSQSEPNSTSCKPRSQKESSLDCLWSSLVESNQTTLSSPPFNRKLKRNDSPSTSSSPESNRTAQNSPVPGCKPLKSPASNSNNNVLSLPLSQVKSRKPPLLSHSSHLSHSLSMSPPKPKTVLRGDHGTRALSPPVCHSKVQSPRSTSPSDKHRVRQLPSVHPKPNISSPRVSSPKPCVKNKNASVSSFRLQSKGNVEQGLKPEPENEVPWSLNYSHPCIIKGGTVPVDVVNKIVNSISKSTIQKDLSRQILFRRMRGKPNPRPGPRLSSTYTVCLECASCIKSQCCHLQGKKDPRCATLFVIPTPESSADGKVDVKIVLILSLPETSSSCYQFRRKDNQPDDNAEALDGNLEELEKITQFFPASESDFIQGIKTNQKWLPVSSEDKDKGQGPQAIDWLLYVKNMNNIQPPTPVQAPSSYSSSSCSSSHSSFSASSSSNGFPSPPSPSSPGKEPTPAPLSGYVLAKVRSHHRLPPGVSWLEFIRGTGSETTKIRQSASPKTKRVRTRTPKTMKKGKKGTGTLLKYFQTKFQNEKS